MFASKALRGVWIDATWGCLTDSWIQAITAYIITHLSQYLIYFYTLLLLYELTNL